MTVLYVGSTETATAVADRLADCLPGFTVTSGDGERAPVDRIDEAAVECVVGELDLDDRTGIDLLRAVRDRHPHLPFILVASDGSEAAASAAIEAGVTDYCRLDTVDDDIAPLAERIRHAVETERTRRKAERRRTHIEAVVEKIEDGVVTIDSTSTIQFANPAVENLFGYPPDELEGEPLTRLIPERYREPHLTALERHLETGERTRDWRTVQLTGLRADGTEVPLSVSFTEFEQDGEWRFTGVIRDISEATRIEARLREQEERFRQLAEHLNEVVWVVDPESDSLEYVNPAFERIWGRPIDDIKADSKGFVAGIHPADRDRIERKRASLDPDDYDEEYRVVRPDDTVRWVRDRAVPVEGPDGEISRIIGIASDITDFKHRERRLKRSRDRFEHLQRFSEAGYWEIDPRSGPPYDVTISEELYRIHGIPQDEPFDLRKGLEFYHPDDRATIDRAVHRALSDGEPYDLEARLITADGDLRWVHTVCEPIEEDGEVVLLRGMLQDITTRRSHQQELQQTIDRVTDAIVKVDADWRFTFIDDRAAEIYDVDAAALLGRGFWDVFADALGTRFESTYRRVMADRTPETLEEYFEGLEGWFQVNIYPDDDGGLSFYFRDITERKERERTLELRRALLEAQSEASIDGLLVVDEDRNIILYNDRFLEIWELDPALLEAESDDPLVMSRVLDRIEDSTEFIETVEYLYDHPYEESRDVVELSNGRFIDRYSAPVIDDGGTHYGRLWVFRDITDRKENERKLEQHKDRLEAFASIVSHDLRNPLNVAEGHMALLREERSDDRLEHVAGALDRMRTLIEDLLALARANETVTDLEPVDLAELAEACWRNVDTHEASLRLLTTRELTADESRLGQVLENLIRNAIQHGGHDLTVTIEDVPDGFAVEDTGPGIDSADPDRIFESGYSTETDGTGLGLAIVNTIVDAHGWSISVTNAPDGGARFEITGVDVLGGELPRSDDPSGTAQGDAPR